MLVPGSYVIAATEMMAMDDRSSSDDRTIPMYMCQRHESRPRFGEEESRFGAEAAKDRQHYFGNGIIAYHVKSAN
jgi:hypothetical protein